MKLNGNHPKMTFVSKGWGFERWIVNKPEYCGKLLYMAKDKKCSLHYHKNKDEVFYVQSGKLEVKYGNVKEVKEHLERVGKRALDGVLETVILEKGDNFHVPPGRVHQMTALQDTELFEFSTQHFEEDSVKLIKGD